MLYDLYTSDFFNKSELWHLSDITMKLIGLKTLLFWLDLHPELPQRSKFTNLLSEKSVYFVTNVQRSCQYNSIIDWKKKDLRKCWAEFVFNKDVCW